MDLRILPPEYQDKLFEELSVMTQRDVDKDGKKKIISKDEIKKKI